MVERKRMRVSEKCVGAVRRGIYVERGGANGRALDYWLQAAAELKRLLRRGRHARRKNRSITPRAARGRRPKLPQEFESRNRNSKESANGKAINWKRKTGLPGMKWKMRPARFSGSFRKQA
jgi:hypothetical protein